MWLWQHLDNGNDAETFRLYADFIEPKYRFVHITDWNGATMVERNSMC